MVNPLAYISLSVAGVKCKFLISRRTKLEPDSWCLKRRKTQSHGRFGGCKLFLT